MKPVKPIMFLALSGSLLLVGCNSTATAPDTYTYICDSGAKITATYPDTDSAHVSYLGHEHIMHIAIAASGARYVGDQLVWWTKGPEGTLFQRHADGDNSILEQCSQPH